MTDARMPTTTAGGQTEAEIDAIRRLFRALAPVARPLVARVARLPRELLQQAGTASLRRPIDAAVSALACEAGADTDPALAARAEACARHFVTLNAQLAEADATLRASGARVARATPEEDALSALLELATASGQDLVTTLEAAGRAIAATSWPTDAAARAHQRTTARLRAPDEPSRPDIPQPGDETPAFGIHVLAETARYGTLVEVRRLDTGAATPASGVSLEVGAGLLCLIDTARGAPFFADAVTSLSNVVVAEVTGGGTGVRLQLERPDRTVVVEVIPAKDSPESVAHALALLAERARRGR